MAANTRAARKPMILRFMGGVLGWGGWGGERGAGGRSADHLEDAGAEVGPAADLAAAGHEVGELAVEAHPAVARRAGALAVARHVPGARLELVGEHRELGEADDVVLAVAAGEPGLVVQRDEHLGVLPPGDVAVGGEVVAVVAAQPAAGRDRRLARPGLDRPAEPAGEVETGRRRGA